MGVLFLLATFFLISVMLIISGCCGITGQGNFDNAEIGALKSECDSLLMQDYPSSLLGQGWQIAPGTLYRVHGCHKGNQAGEKEEYTYCVGEYYKNVKEKNADGTIKSNYNHFFSVTAVYSSDGFVEGSCTYMQKSEIAK